MFDFKKLTFKREWNRRTEMSLFLCLIHKDFGALYRVSKSVERESESISVCLIQINKRMYYVLQNFIEQKLE